MAAHGHGATSSGGLCCQHAIIISRMHSCTVKPNSRLVGHLQAFTTPLRLLPGHAPSGAVQASITRIECCISMATSRALPDWSCTGQFYDVARKEIAALILSDDHPNVLRCYAMEEDEAFVYLALERCSQSLSDLMQSDRGRLMDSADNPTEFACQVAPMQAAPDFSLTRAASSSVLCPCWESLASSSSSTCIRLLFARRSSSG